MNINEFHRDAAEALESGDGIQFIEKWVPIITNTIEALRQEKSFLEIELEATQSEKEEVDD